MFAGVVEVDDLHRATETVLDHVPDPLGAVAEEDDRTCRGVASFQRLVIEPRTEVPNLAEGRDVGGREWVALGVAVGIARLREDTPELDLTGLGAAVGLFAANSLEFFGPHRDARHVGLKVENVHGTRVALRGASLHPDRGVCCVMLKHARDLAVGNVQAGEALEGPGGLFEGRVHGAGPTHELGNRWGVLLMQAELLIQGASAALRSQVVRATQLDGAEQSQYLSATPGMKLLTGSQLGRRQQLRQFMVKKLLQHLGGVLLGGRPQGGLEPNGVERGFPRDLLASDV